MRSKILVAILLSLIFPVMALAKVNINTAGATELDTIPEIGPATATKIIAYREANGPFAVIEDIMKVSGIKDVTFAKMKDFITVDDDGENGNEPENQDDESGSDDDGENSSTDDSVSGHSSTQELTAVEKKETFKIGAGRKRVAVVGAPVNFEAAVSGGAERARFEWSFGDGGRVRGRRATHHYYFPGLYNVVLNGRLDDEEAIARTQVEVVEPELSLALVAGGAVKISNPTKREINLGGWRLAVGEQAFVIPSDTLLDAGGSTTIPPEISRLGPTKIITFQNPAGRVVAQVDETVARHEKILALQNQLTQARAQLAKLSEVKPRYQGLASLAATTSAPEAPVSVIELAKPVSRWKRLINEIF